MEARSTRVVSGSLDLPFDDPASCIRDLPSCCGALITEAVKHRKSRKTYERYRSFTIPTIAMEVSTLGYANHYLGTRGGAGPLG